ncbi:hypothetical protein RHSIM_Rhsim04G0057800 [Rhododendron simsii]|uniref:Terpene synthase metal-binding domain-containing protein n=1 Tax=Rhododendron simsii TaxID=118357 RepID=A0A834H5Y5_RHOSS|nr:hypothetical protein RHSIM_Rhsim04G0057800 [Rhododendron simsii]
MVEGYSQQPSERRSAHYQPTAWNSDFVESLKNHDNTDEIQKQRAEKLKEDVRAMIGDTYANSLTILELIDDIQRLGLSYNFDKDIKRALDKIILSVNGNNVMEDQKIGVHDIALYFRLCRQHGHEVSQALVTTIDDVYDVYGSLDELELFTAAVQRWDIEVVEILPDYMKLCFLALYNTTNEMGYDILKQKGVNIIPHLKRAWADLCKTFLKEAKWCSNRETPTFKAYLDNALVSVSGVLISVHVYFLLTETITKEALECLEKKLHPLVECSSLIFRFSNDLATSKAELERGESANSILCYMHETGSSEREARKHISSLIEEAWKKMNKERVAADSPFEKPFIETAFNLARIAQCTYQNGDGHGAPDNKAKNRVLSVIIEPITLMQRLQHQSNLLATVS